jgi:hypothetical protein
VYLRLNAPAPRGSINADLSSLRRPAVDDFGSKCVELGDGLHQCINGACTVAVKVT